MDLVADREERLDVFLSRSLPEISRTKLARAASEGKVLVNGRAQRPSFRLEPGMSVSLDPPKEQEPHDLRPADIPLDVRYEDEHLLVVNKPRGLASHGAPTLRAPSLVNALLARAHGLSAAGGAFRPGIVHRLDKETTGLILVAKSDRVHLALARQISEKSAVRRYVAVVHGVVERPRFSVEAPIGRDPRNRQRMAIRYEGKPAVTHVKLLEVVGGLSVLAMQLETGRTHQIRVHLAAVGHPVIGDAAYGASGGQAHS